MGVEKITHASRFQVGLSEDKPRLDLSMNPRGFALIESHVPGGQPKKSRGLL
jgi:hypothetical protein